MKINKATKSSVIREVFFLKEELGKIQEEINNCGQRISRLVHLEEIDTIVELNQDISDLLDRHGAISITIEDMQQGLNSLNQPEDVSVDEVSDDYEPTYAERMGR